MDAVACPLCASQQLAVFLEEQDKELSSAALGSSRTEVSPGRILRCRSCEFGFRQWRPDDTQLSELYSRLDTRVYESELQGRMRTARRHLKILQRYCSPGRLLDIGCALGLLLRSATDAGWEVVGVEPARVLYDKARELLGDRGQVICATLQQAGLPPASFDVVTLWDVLEHVSDPLTFVRSCASLLRPGGLLFLNVPDLDSWQARLLGARWPLLLPEHLNYFNRRSLRLCGERVSLTWVSFLRRNVSFSVEYVLYRMAQHEIPGAARGYRLAHGSFVGRTSVALPLGELCGVWRKKRESAEAPEVPT